MTTRRAVGVWLAATAAVIALTSLAPAAEPEKVLLRYGGAAGDTARYQVAFSGREQTTGAGLEEAFRSELSVQMECLVEWLEDGSGTARPVKGKVTSGSATSRAEGEEQTLEFEEVTARYMVTPRGEIESYEVTEGEPPMLHIGGGAMAPGPEDGFLLSGWGVLPEGPVKKGDTWSGTALIPTPFGEEPMGLDYEAAYLGREEHRGISCHRIRTAVRFEDEEAQSDPEAGEMRMAARLAAECTWLLDAERGVIVFADGSNRVTTTVTFESPDGESNSLEAAGVINMRSVLTEFNGRKLGG